MAKYQAKKAGQNPVTENTQHSTADNAQPDTEAEATVDAKIEENTETQTEMQENDAIDNAQTQDNTKEQPMQEKQMNTINEPPVQAERVIVKKGGKGVAILALLVALGLGGAGYYFAEQHLTQVQGRLTALEQRAVPANVQGLMDSELATLKQAQSKIAQLTETSQATNEKLIALEKMVAIKEQQITALQSQVSTLSNAQKAAQPNDWLLSEADFLLNNALRKLVLDNDVDTAVSLLKVADETLSKVSDPRVINVRTAINSDLKQLLSVNNIDQNAIMQRLSQLANNVDELTVLNVNFDDPNPANEKLSGSWDDWKENAEKSAVSFLNHFIRITPKNADSRALLAPNQDIYLRENIRLRLQLAIMAVPRQQNDLYKQSLEMVASWVRSYFDTNTEVAQNFLNEIDELADQSIYVDVPNHLNSLNLLDKLLNKPSQEVQKIELSVDKEVAKENTEEIKAESPAESVNAAAEANSAEQNSDSSSNETPNNENKSAVEKSPESEAPQQ
ncbi:uroporphyrinogen-III C-methyltransferase [Avibacterium paragallinarum]|uniref:uroporphyrinogen-III C-methyltransferase n=1 Tax=Avibacterium paragallinarum TaxID=728 RepID=UPI00397B5D59